MRFGQFCYLCATVTQGDTESWRAVWKRQIGEPVVAVSVARRTQQHVVANRRAGLESAPFSRSSRPRLGGGTRRRYASSSPSRITKAATASTPSPSRMQVKTNGRSPRILRASRSITSSDAPTCGREIGLVDDQQIGPGDAGAALARDLVAAGDVDHVERQVGQLGAEGGGQVVAAALDDDEVERRGSVRDSAVDGVEVDRRVLADRGVRAAAGLDADDALLGQRAAAHQELRVLLGVDVVGDDGDLVAGRAGACRARRPARSCPSRRGRRRRRATVAVWSCMSCSLVMIGTAGEYRVSCSALAIAWPGAVDAELVVGERQRARRRPPGSRRPRPRAGAARRSARAGPGARPRWSSPRPRRRRSRPAPPAIGIVEAHGRQREHRRVRDVRARRPRPPRSATPSAASTRASAAPSWRSSARDLARRAAGGQPARSSASTARAVAGAPGVDAGAPAPAGPASRSAMLEQAQQPVAPRSSSSVTQPDGDGLLQPLRVGEGADRQRRADAAAAAASARRRAARRRRRRRRVVSARVRASGPCSCPCRRCFAAPWR